MSAFETELGQKLQAYGQELERTTLPALKTHFRTFTSILSAFMNLLKQRGFMNDDPYQYDEKISEITPVSNEPFLENQKSTIMDIRLHNFALQLNFLNDFYQFSLDYFTLPRLKVLSQFVRFIRWEAFSETSTEINTRLVAELISRLRRGEDAVSTGLINDMIGQFATYQEKILDAIKKVSFYKREEYKFLIRSTFWESLNISAEEYAGNTDNVMLRIRKEFAAHVKGQPFIPELLKEILEEDFSSGGESLRAELLQKLKVVPVIQETPKQKVDHKATLMEAVRTLGSLNIPLESALRKLRENTVVYEDDRTTVGTRFKRWLASLVGIKERSKSYDIEVFDPSTALTRTETLDLDQFKEDVQTRIRILVGLANRASPNFLALAQRSETEILATFDRIFVEISRFNERFNGLDLFFKTETPKEKRIRIRGVKTEIAQIKTIQANANKLKHEYVAAREEEEQLKKLGLA